MFRIVTSVPGIGTQNAVFMMVYTNNFRKFGYDPRKIACYYGIAPFGMDSGTSIHSQPHVHYMANRRIKAMLTMAAMAAVRYNPAIALYYNGLLKRGKRSRSHSTMSRINSYISSLPWSEKTPSTTYNTKFQYKNKNNRKNIWIFT